MTTTEDRTWRRRWAALVAAAGRGELVAPSALDLARAAAAAEDEEEGLRSGRLIHCPNCGAPTPRSQLMAASLGTACPECYDSLSDDY